MKKLMAFFVLMAMPASASVVATSPMVVAGPQYVWAKTSLENGGYARCKNPNGCRTWSAPFTDVVAQYGDVYEGVLFDGWSGSSDSYPSVETLVVYPIGTKGIPYSGIHSRADDWEGVAQAPHYG